MRLASGTTYPTPIPEQRHRPDPRRGFEGAVWAAATRPPRAALRDNLKALTRVEGCGRIQTENAPAVQARPPRGHVRPQHLPDAGPGEVAGPCSSMPRQRPPAASEELGLWLIRAGASTAICHCGRGRLGLAWVLRCQ